MSDRPPTLAAVRDLARRRGSLVAGGFVPLAAGVPEARQNGVRLRHVADALGRRLDELEVPPVEIKRVTGQLAPFFEDATPPAPGIAARCALCVGEANWRFGIPDPVEGRAFVGRSSPVTPLLRAARRGRRYRVVAISANRVHVSAGDVRGLVPDPQDELPASLVDALGSELEGVGLQFHSTRSGGEAAVYHGHHDASREREVDQERYHRVLRSGLLRALGGSDLPVILVADRTHHGLLDELAPRVPFVGAVEGSPDDWSEAELHARTWPRLDEASKQESAAEAQALERARDRGQAALGLQAAIEAVVDGRVRRLWLPAGSEVGGRVDEAARRAGPAWGDERLFDDLACVALQRGASVRVVDADEAPLPDAEVAAELW